MRVLALVLLLTVLAAPRVPRTASTRLSEPTPPPGVLVARARTEPALALDPRDPAHLVIAANPDFYHLRPNERLNDAFTSHDGGASWSEVYAPTHGAFTGVADPSLAIDAAGRSYYLFMGETPSFCGESGNVALLLARSPAGSDGFGSPTVVDVNPDDDKPFLAVRSDTGAATVFAAFTRWTSRDRRIMFTRSTDGGRTFAPPATIFASGGVNMGALPVPGAGQRLYLLWAHYDSTSFYVPLHASILMRVSPDDGRTFGPLVTVASFTALPRLLVPGSLRLFTFPTAAVDPASGTLYVAWGQARSLAHPAYPGEMDADVMLTRSHDGGRTFAPPLRLNDTPAGDRFMPALSAGAGGTVNVAFYDRRADHVRFALYGVAVRDRGERAQIWPNVLIGAPASPYVLHYIAPGSTCVAPGRFMGDYISTVTTPHGGMGVSWVDTALGVPQESDLWFARVPLAYLRAGVPRLAPW